MSLIPNWQNFVKYVAALAVTLTLVACGAPAQLTREYLDPETGVTVTSIGTPLILYRDNASLAAFARNYVYLGPIEVNRMGSFQYFLWLSAWNTMETADPDRIRDSFDTITVFADGEPLLLELAGLTPATIGTSRPVYLKPVASAADAYYRVTADQIRVIAEAREIRLRTSGSAPREYQPWDEQRAAHSGFRAFLSAALL